MRAAGLQLKRLSGYRRAAGAQNDRALKRFRSYHAVDSELRAVYHYRARFLNHLKYFQRVAGKAY